MIEAAILKKISEMDEANDDKPLPFGWHMIRVEHPEPIIYTFRLTGLLCFVWVKEFDRKHGKYEANRRAAIRRCTALELNPDQKEPFRVNSDGNLCINGETMGWITIMQAASKPDRAFRSADMKLFFEKWTSALNDADVWLDDMASEWRRQIG